MHDIALAKADMVIPWSTNANATVKPHKLAPSTLTTPKTTNSKQSLSSTHAKHPSLR